jgi:hypothetical protein
MEQLINILFLQKLTGTKLIEPSEEMDKVKDYRLDYMYKKIDTGSISHDSLKATLKKIESCLTKHSYDTATTTLVQFGLDAWRSQDAEVTITKFSEDVCKLIADNPLVHQMRDKQRKKWSHKQKGFFYFVSHIVLVLFNYGTKNGPFSDQLLFILPVLQTLWSTWDSLLLAPKDNRELLIELWWITVLAKEYVPTLSIPDTYESILKPGVKKLISSFTTINIGGPGSRFGATVESCHFALLVLIVKNKTQVDLDASLLFHHLSFCFSFGILFVHCRSAASWAGGLLLWGGGGEREREGSLVRIVVLFYFYFFQG